MDVAVGISEEGPLASGMVHPRRLVTLQRDDADFVVTFYPENLVVFRHAEPNALRKVCTGLRWKIISDGSNASDFVATPLRLTNFRHKHYELQSR